MARGLLFLVVLFFSAPYLLLIQQFEVWQKPDMAEFFWALENSFLQAAGSTLLAAVIGICLIPGCWFFQCKWRTLSSWLLLVPSLLPPLFVLLAFFLALDPFPIGIVGVVLVQGFMYGGFFAAELADRIENRLSGLADVAKVFGSKRVFFLRKSWGLYSSEVFSILFGIFLVCFTSFSIPVLIGGGRGTNLEVLIYEKLRLGQQVGQALFIVMIQWLIILPFVFLKNDQQKLELKSRSEMSFLSSKFSALLLILYVSFFALPIILNLLPAFRAISEIDGLWGQVAELMPFTVLTSLCAGFLCLLLCLVFGLYFPQNYLNRFARSWLMPGAVFIGFAFWSWVDHAPTAFYTLALLLLFFLSAYRIFVGRQLELLQRQIEVGQVLGASSFLIWRQIVVPQIWRPSCLAAGIVSIWSIGEFALGQVMLSQTASWAQLSESLLASYRTDAALGVGIIILFVGFLMFLFFRGVGHVFDFKYK